MLQVIAAALALLLSSSDAPVAALLIGAVLVAILALAGLALPPARRRARGNGTYGRER